MSNCCSHGTLPHFGLQSSHLNICYYHQDLHWSAFQEPPHGVPFVTRPTFSYSARRRAWRAGRVWAAHLSAIHFQG